MCSVPAHFSWNTRYGRARREGEEWEPELLRVVRDDEHSVCNEKRMNDRLDTAFT